ncbi:MAG: hypothetical protein KIH08_03800 [Candidatus Freyarchaeota archaeon]|nr:hypothetical protein [Candidatus Jordarchaeia archaeon]MBS7268201.1 hypothetical protein [Candidatus Jordarchaeia archaeon]MBS7279460.1 hypothetical protein [Candidatus Jordarchaeia archaeon]
MAPDVELDEQLEYAYEINVRGETISPCLYIFSKQPIIEEDLDEKVQSVLSTFNLGADYTRMRFEILEEEFLSLIGGAYFTAIRKVKGEKNILILDANESPTYIAVLILKGAPNCESLDPHCLDLFLNSIESLDANLTLVIPFRFLKRRESERTYKNLETRVRVKSKTPIKYCEASPYLVVRGASLESIKNHMERVYAAASAAWSGVRERINVEFLDCSGIKKFLHNIICRRLLPDKDVFFIKNLSIYLKAPTPTNEKKLNFPIGHANENPKSNISNIDRVLLGKTALGGRTVSVWMYYENLLHYVVIFGESYEKACFIMSILEKIKKPWIVFDFKGDFSKLKGLCNDSISFFSLNSGSEQLKINLFDPKEKSPEEHASFLISIFKKFFENKLENLQEPLHRILSHFSNTLRCEHGLREFDNAFNELLKSNDSKKETIIRELALLLHNLQQGALSSVFSSSHSNIGPEIADKRVIIDLNHPYSETDIIGIKFLTTYILALLSRVSSEEVNGLKHVTVINCPENGSELINFLTKTVLDKSTLLKNGEGLILSVPHPQDFKSIYGLDSCYAIIFDGLREPGRCDEIIGGINPGEIENLGGKALIIMPGTGNKIKFEPDWDKILVNKEASPAPKVEHIDNSFKAPATLEMGETSGEFELKHQLQPIKNTFVTADQFLRGVSNSKISFEPPYNLSGEQVAVLVNQVLAILDSEIYLTDLFISKITGIPPKAVNKIMLEVLNTDSGIQRIYVPVVGSKTNIPLYYSKFGPKYENVQDKYLKDVLEEVCFKNGVNFLLKRDPETGADGKIESYNLKLFVQIPNDGELKSTFQKLFLKFNRVAVLFLHEKDLKKAEKLNSQWKIPILMGSLTNLNTFLTEIVDPSTEKTSNLPYSSEKDLQELISWLRTET